MSDKKLVWIMVGLVLLVLALGFIVGQVQGTPQSTTNNPPQGAAPTDTSATQDVSAPTVQQQLGGMLNGDSGIMTYAGTVDVTYTDQTQIVDVRMSMIHTDSESIKWTAYYAMKDIWTSGITTIKGVSITMLSDVTNNVVAEVYQDHTLDWNNLDQDSAWNAYTTATLL